MPLLSGVHAVNGNPVCIQYLQYSTVGDPFFYSSYRTSRKKNEVLGYFVRSKAGGYDTVVYCSLLLLVQYGTYAMRGILYCTVANECFFSLWHSGCDRDSQDIHDKNRWL